MSSRISSCVRNRHYNRSRKDTRASSKLLAIFLLFAFVSSVLPVQTFASQLQPLWSVFALVVAPQKQPMSARQQTGRGVRPQAVSRDEQRTRAAMIQIHAGKELLLQLQQPAMLTAKVVDNDGNTLHGVRPEWTSSNPRIVSVSKSGRALATNRGTAVVTATAGSVSRSMRVTVIGGNDLRLHRKKVQDSRRQPRSIATNGKRQHARQYLRSLALMPPLPQRPPNEDPLPDSETGSLYDPGNVVGSPPGKRKPGAITRAVATGGTENGNKNFTFALPIVSLPGRGLNVSLSLVHNSQAWHKSTDPSDNSVQMTYDVDSGWPAPGFRLSLGQIEDQGSYGFTLTEADGTRHALTATSTYNLYETTDGTYIQYYDGGSWGTLVYADGTYMWYAAAGSGSRLYPTLIEDRNGNYLTIDYVNNVGPKIAAIQDTLGREVEFHYASSGDLVAITAPGLTGSSDLQVMRFYYTDVSIGSGLFGSGVTVNAPGSVHTLQYVYLPASSEGSYAHIGYKFDYTTYGVMYQTKQFRGMTVSSTSLSSAGNVTEGSNTVAATTTYNYPTSASALTDVPSYTTRTDEWAGRTTGMPGTGNAPFYTFVVTENTNDTVSTVTAPDGTITETKSVVSTDWTNGLVTETKVQYLPSASPSPTPIVLVKTQVQWERDSNNQNPRVYEIKKTDVPAGLTAATVLSYTSYNNVSVVSERAFTTDGTVSTTEVRRTETSYVTSSPYMARHHFHLPATVKVFPGGSSTPVSRVDYAYDGSTLTPRADIIMHDDVYNPYCLAEGKCTEECVEWGGDPMECVQWQTVCPYDFSTDYRGNPTSVKTYPVATADPSSSSNIVHETAYDIVGNVVSTEVDCCQLKTFGYSSSSYYAYPTSVTTGNPSGVHLTTSASYDFNTGLVATTTDENGQVTTNYYNSDSLRPNHVQRPDGGVTNFFYGDALWANAASRYHFYTMVATQLDSTNWSEVYRFFDGRGALAQVFYDGSGSGPWTTQVIEYDPMGRAYRSTNPFADGGYGGTVTGLWTTKTFDQLGRITSIAMPSGEDANPTTATVNIAYDGVYTTVTNQAGKVRRQKVDEFGRVIRLDEPTTSGLGATTSPNRPTSYQYDALDNLLKITQEDQSRYFKYDSLSRLIRERQVEQTTNSSYDLSDAVNTSGSWTRKLVYNSSGLVTSTHDARGVQTSFSYDDLNRVTQISYSDSTPTAHYYYDSQTLPSGAPSYTHGYATGRLLAMTYGSGATGNYFGYDQMGNIVTQKQVTGSTTYGLSYSYNLAGMLTSETYPSNRTVNYDYGYGGRLTTVREGSSNYASSMTYAPSGALTSETWGNTAVHTRAYNRALQVSQIKLSINSAEKQRYNYLYGEVTPSSGSVDTSKNTGQIARIDAHINGSSTKEWDQRLIYDELGRLSTAAEYQQGTGSTPTWQVKYSYDRYGNRFQSGSSDNFGVPFTPVVSTDIVTATNRFIDSGSTPVTYDAAGNITQDMKFRLSGSLGVKYEYDANGRQTVAKLSNNTSLQTSVYDCAGQRVQTTAGSTTRTMVYDIFSHNVADYVGSFLERENIYRSGQLLVTYEAGSSSYKYVLADAQGSVRALVNNSGSSSAIIARHDYQPFGEELSSGVGLRTSGQGYGATDTNRQKYGLTERDDTTGLDHAWFRKYEQLSGRWTSPDPTNGSMTIGDPQSLNRYTYTQNDPANFIDPDGLLPWSLWNTMFDVPYFIPASQNGWNQMFGLNPISFTFTMSWHIGDGYWISERTSITLWPHQQTQEDRLQAGLAELRKRLEANNGDNPCAKFFGGLKNAQKALKDTKFKFKTPDRPDASAQTKGKNVLLNPTGNFFSNSEHVILEVGFDIRPPATLKTISLGKLEAAAFILAHELGHRTNKLLTDDRGLSGILNNGKIRDACFPEAAVSTEPVKN